jgi:5-methylcytosine-specific restriction endonuclease McrA
MLCEAWFSTKAALKMLRQELPEGRRYYTEGTTDPPYDQHASELVRRLVWQKLQSAILRRDKYRCQDCGLDFKGRRRKVFDAGLKKGRGGYRQESLEVHHIIPRFEGGSDHPGNLKTLCPRCHRGYTKQQTSTRTDRRRGRAERLRTLEAEGYTEETDYDPRD